MRPIAPRLDGFSPSPPSSSSSSSISFYLSSVAIPSSVAPSSLDVVATPSSERHSLGIDEEKDDWPNVHRDDLQSTTRTTAAAPLITEAFASDVTQVTDAFDSVANDDGNMSRGNFAPLFGPTDTNAVTVVDTQADSLADTLVENDGNESFTSTVTATNFTFASDMITNWSSPPDWGPPTPTTSSPSLSSLSSSPWSPTWTSLSTLDGNSIATNETAAPKGLSPDDPWYPVYVNMHYVCHVINFVAAFGILGNLLTFYVLFRRRAKTPPIVIMMALAIFDSILLILIMFDYGLVYISMFNETGLRPYATFHTKYKAHLHTATNIAQTVIVWLTLFLSVERYTAICRPLKFMANCTHHRAMKTISLIVFFSISLNIVRFFEISDGYQIVNEETGESNCYRNAGCINSSLRTNRVYWFLYYVVILPLLNQIGPFLIILVLNVQVIRVHKESLRWRQQHFAQQENGRGIKGEQHSVTLICVAVVVMFLLCYLPENALAILKLFEDTSHPSKPCYATFTS